MTIPFSGPDPAWVLETERLAFRRFTRDDLPQLIEQRSDPDVNKYLGGIARQNPEALSKRLDFYISCYSSHGVGMCPMIWKGSGEVIGTAGLQPLEDTGEIEVGYSLVRKFWGMGIATEAAIGWMKYGFDVIGLDRIVAVAVEENAASRRILEKVGMSYERSAVHYDELCAFYGMSRKEFSEGQSV